MKVSREFLKDFAEIANRYGWNADDIEEVKAHMREHFEPMRRYWSTLAAAHRAGYEQTRENGYMRLHVWCEQNGSLKIITCLRSNSSLALKKNQAINKPLLGSVPKHKETSKG